MKRILPTLFFPSEHAKCANSEEKAKLRKKPAAIPFWSVAYLSAHFRHDDMFHVEHFPPLHPGGESCARGARGRLWERGWRGWKQRPDTRVVRACGLAYVRGGRARLPSGCAWLSPIPSAAPSLGSGLRRRRASSIAKDAIRVGQPRLQERSHADPSAVPIIAGDDRLQSR